MMQPVASLDEVRREIDRIDRDIVRLLAERGVYVREAARFKPTVADVHVPSRVEAVVANARTLADTYGLDPAVAERIYRALIAAFTDHEIEVHQQR